MESAVPRHLACPRTRTQRADERYTPPYPAWTARFTPSVRRVAMLYIGAQYRGGVAEGCARAGLERLRGWSRGTDGPRHAELAACVDEAGYSTLVLAAWWDDPGVMARWLATAPLTEWWNSPERLDEGVGWFRETACPGVDRFETLFSTTDGLQGVGCLAGALSGEIREHGYWGGMRDRLPCAQTDVLAPTGEPSRELLPGAGARVRVRPGENLALIHSGQDWRATGGRERAFYLDDVEPALREGMRFLSEQGLDVGCYGNRYLRCLDDDFAPVERSYGLGWWRSLEHLERWAESHPTHVAIFGGFMRMVKAMDFQLELRLFHEVSVLRAEDLAFEYVNCHPGTGLLRVAV